MSSLRDLDDIELISTPITLPNGVTIPNRLVKAAMEEGIAHWGGLPGEKHRKLYERWGDGGWGVVITGNVQVDPGHLATPHDRSYPSSTPDTIAAYKQLQQSAIGSPESSTSHRTRAPPLTICQLSHPGLQSSSTACFSRWPWSPAVAPIGTRPDMSGIMGWLISRVLWPRQSRILDVQGWLRIVDLFVDSAKGMEMAGWDGVQIHSAHGYLLAEWISPLTNPEAFPLPGVPASVDPRLHPLYLIVMGIRRSTPPSFVLSIKLNCSDFTHGGLTEDYATTLITEIVSWKKVDILEISGGTYSSPAFATPETVSTPDSRQSLFAHFTTSLLPHLPRPPGGPAIILTGGMHDRPIIASAIRDEACDLVGIGRPACIRPDIPNRIILNPDLSAEQTRLGGYNIPGSNVVKRIFGGGSKSGEGIPLVGAGVSTLWHEWQLCRMGRGVEPDLGMDWIWGGVILELLWFGLLRGGPLVWFSSLWRSKIAL
ncbi:hypothetical protein BD324DRAFT_637184 [Kockovaella imperatae]|uniref:NADH:flavin oxidoreductase/NADH oxidase N-terminal domain-containing protein n=1 Tax=Kockovaella imperatae TaxID=4999 RepID=A0A1Y1U893_9TREE|nr:hypothetical protein BD324DRAFT_637184 [Kockovaella imperatae]ORX34233.1 hypothetical protein BD324DRAFT_637184 [Kockovaella imperatae]